MYEIDLLKLSEFFKNEIIVEQRKKIKELEKELSYRDCFIERLNRHLEDYCKRCEELEQEKNWHKTSDEISKANSKYTAKLKQALKEIKEIAENGKRFAERYMITGEQKANVLTYANAILQKISEVIDETNTDNTI